MNTTIETISCKLIIKNINNFDVNDDGKRYSNM